MNSRERVIAALNHEETDRIPIDIGSSRATGFTTPAYKKLLFSAGLEEIPTVIDVKLFLSEVSPEIIDYFNGDTIGVFRQKVSLGLRGGNYKETILNGIKVNMPLDYNTVEDDAGNLIIIDSMGRPIAKKPYSGYFFDVSEDKPLSRVDSMAGLDNFDWSFLVFDEEEKEYIKGKAVKLFTETDKAVIGNIWFNMLERALALRGFAEFLTDLAINEVFAVALMEHILDAYKNNLEWYLKEVVKYTQVICLSDDLGTQSSLFVSPDMYRKIIKPFHKRLISYIKEKSDVFVFFHSCGAIEPIIGDLIEAGIDILNPIQLSANGMDPEILKRKYGKNITFWGGTCDSQHILPFGSVSEVKTQTKKNINILKKGGGFVFAPTHNFQPDVPVENIRAFFQSVKNI